MGVSTEGYGLHEEGRIKETRIIMDIFGLMMQLGVLPPPAP